MGVARTFQNIRLFSKLSVLDNVLIAKHMRAKQNVFSATFRLNAAEEKRMREESLALLEEQNLLHLKENGIRSYIKLRIMRNGRAVHTKKISESITT